MAAAIIDTDYNEDDASGTTLAFGSPVASEINACHAVAVKWEGTSTAITVGDTVNSYAVWTPGNKQFDFGGNANNDLCGTILLCPVALSTGNLTVTVTWASARPGRYIEIYTIRPTSGYTLAYDTSAVAQGRSTTPSAGSAAPSTNSSFAITWFSLYGGRALTPGTGWLETAELDRTSGLVGEYRIPSTTASITGDAAFGLSVEWIAQMLILKEVASATTIPQANPTARGGMSQTVAQRSVWRERLSGILEPSREILVPSYAKTA